MSVAVMLFQRDLRLADNPALHAACDAHAQVLPVYIHAPADAGNWPDGAASRWWLHQSLAALGTALRAAGSDLQLYRGNTLEIVRRLVRDAGAAAVYWNRRYEPSAIASERLLEQALRAEGIAVHTHNAGLWCEPWQIETGQGTPYRVFTPYWRRLRPQLQATEPLPVPQLRGSHALPGTVPLQALALLPRVAWAGGLAENWQPGEAGAAEMLDLFLDDAIGDYLRGRDLPARHGTSRLSPHLHFGEISPRQIHHALDRAAAGAPAARRPDMEPYLRQLGWREFAHHLLYHYPSTPVENFNPGFAGFRWAPPDEAVLARWQQGHTGIPLVDAGMRELWHTGWMHNRVRMIVASFLAKNLRQHWLHGARWFWDTLVDADLANNTMGWQWVAGCGADAAPYFRVFNPITQARKFDPAGEYLRRWLPELGSATSALLHTPWQDPALLKRSGYPAPMVDLASSRTQALEAWQSRH
ncbi:MAG: deoxyribodipyrimidine photo-lyase [Luteimonas sp.]